jgi:PadR family transcriptional regulator, regulatory protein PadR
MTAKADLPQGTLDLLILKVIAFGPVHGYAIAQRLQQVSRDVVQVPQGSLYPALHRLENRGLLAADWKQTESGREAKFYHLTRRGRRHLETETAGWQRLTEAVGLILGMAEGGIRRGGGSACGTENNWKSTSTRSSNFILINTRMI